MPGGECKLIEGLEKPNAMAVCETGAVEYWDPTGYRKIPISTCNGGNEMARTGHVYPCPGHEEEYERRHGVSGFVIFLAVILPFAAAGGIGTASLDGSGWVRVAVASTATVPGYSGPLRRSRAWWLSWLRYLYSWVLFGERSPADSAGTTDVHTQAAALLLGEEGTTPLWTLMKESCWEKTAMRTCKLLACVRFGARTI
jgi:hypothetical protein